MKKRIYLIFLFCLVLVSCDWRIKYYERADLVGTWISLGDTRSKLLLLEDSTFVSYNVGCVETLVNSDSLYIEDDLLKYNRYISSGVVGTWDFSYIDQCIDLKYDKTIQTQEKTSRTLQVSTALDLGNIFSSDDILVMEIWHFYDSIFGQRFRNFGVTDDDRYEISPCQKN